MDYSPLFAEPAARKAAAATASLRVGVLAIALAGLALPSCSSDTTSGESPSADDAATHDAQVDASVGPAADAPDESAADAPNEPAVDAPDDPAADAPDESAADAPDDPAADAPDEPAADAPDESAADAPIEGAGDAMVDGPSDAPDAAIQPDVSDEPDYDSGPPDASTGDASDDAPLDAAMPDASAQEAGPDAPGPDCSGGLPKLTLTKVFDGLPGVLFVTSPPSDPSRLFLVQQSGVIRVATQGVLGGQPFLDVSGLISTGGERGLLGLAFHPDYAANGRFWLDFTDPSGNTVVAEFARSAGDPGVAVASPVKTVLTVVQPAANHNGGMLAFGPDGYLYVGMGDGGSAGDPWGNAQNLGVQLGKLLRVDVDAYPTPPPGNMTGPGVDAQLWAYGLRNPWRFSFDALTGDLYIGDVGQSSREEVDVAPSGVGGQNYGWNVMEGTACYPSGSTCDSSGMTQPVAEYDHSVGCSVTGGYVYRGTAIPCLQGWYLYGDYCSRRIFALAWSGGVVHDPVELTAGLQSSTLVNGLTSFGQDADGELYVCSAASGSVFRIEPGNN